MRRIVLFGYRGTGKTEVGTLLARSLGVPFVDTDALIEERSGRSIPEIFNSDGEAAFRNIEREVIAGLPSEGMVVSTGGGVVMDPVNMEHLRAGSTCILLIADFTIISQRLARAPRPALTGLPAGDEISEMLSKRRRNYAAATDFCVDTSTTTPAEAAARIQDLVKEGSIPESNRESAQRWFTESPLPVAECERITSLLTGPGHDPQTRFLGVAGRPSGHSRSPFLFNRLFARYRLNYHYTRFEAPSMRTIMETARSLDAKGLSVTIPFKQEVMEYLDEIDDAALAIGAVNTVVFSCGSTYGGNTDWIGIAKPLAGHRGSRAVLLGAGGVASAAAYALLDLGMDVTILNRTPERAKALAGRIGCRWGNWEDFDAIQPDLVINATPLGMQPDTSSPLRDDQLKKEMTIFDLVYTPPVTPLIAAARKRGCATITGTEVFIHQAKEQFRLFFGIDVPDTVIREILA